MIRSLVVASTVIALFGCTPAETPEPPAVESATAPPAANPNAQVKPQTRYSGPFGLDAGLSVAEVRKVAGLEPSAGVPGAYSTSEVPGPHPAFESYMLQFSDSVGLCKLVAIGKDIPSGDSGYEVRSAFEELSEGVAKKYGKGKHYDFFSGGGSGSPEYWMMYLADRDQTLATVWSEESGATLPESISAISLEAKATNSSEGYLVLSYEFSNIEDCRAELKEKKNEVL